MSAGLIRMPELLALVPVSARTVWRWCRARKFPAPVRIGGRVVAWDRAEVDAWIAARKGERELLLKLAQGIRAVVNAAEAVEAAAHTADSAPPAAQG
jgi:prophage regulatory protein